MATFVLVHGSWHGGWCWRDVRTILHDNGHQVYTPTLTGLGERSHLLSPDINLDTHITDVVNVIEWEELDNVTLVGHSYGGYVVTGVADRIKSRIRHVVYLDAFIPEDGESPASLTVKLKNPDATSEDIEAEVARRKDEADEKSGSPTHYTNMFGIPEDCPDLYHWVKRRITLHPVNSRIQPIRLKNGGLKGLPCTYILCTSSSQKTPFMVLAEKLRSNDNWNYRELPTGHDAMVIMPSETAELLIEAAGTAS